MRTGYADFWMLSKLHALPKETANYVPVILAMTIIAKNAKDYGLDALDPEPALQYDSLELQTSTHLALVADAVGRPLSEIRELNPAVLRSVAPAGYKLHVPQGTVPELEAAFRVVPADRRDAWRLHRVETGDTFAALAKRYNGSTVALVTSANHGELPAAGEWAAIPSAYPGDRAPRASRAAAARKTTAKRTSRKKPGAVTHAATTRKAPAKSASKPAPKSAAHHTTVDHRTTKSASRAG
jgi:membrane-bound lytic murein transglycosylase D